MRLRNVLALVVLAAGGVAVGQDLNLISVVDVRDEGAQVVVSVNGTKPPNFTTFSMADPPRFVIDFSEAKFEGVPADLKTDSSLVRGVRNLSYGSGSSSIARILIAFTDEVDPPDVQAQGSTLVVKIDKPAARAGMLVAKADAAQRAREEAEAKKRAEAEQRAAAEREAQAAAEAQAQAAAEAQAVAAAQAKAAAEAQAAQEAEKKAADDAEKKAADEARLAEARRAKEESEAQKVAAAVAATAAAEQKRTAELERKAEERRQREEAKATALAEAEAKKHAEAERKAEAKRQREEAIAAAKAEAEAKKQAEAERKAEAKRQRDEERRTLAEARVAQARPEEALRAGPAQLREIGFRQMAGVSRFYVRTSATPRFTIQDVGENMIRVELENTRVVRRNDARFLDTSFFPSAVALITPSRQGSSYIVDIKLKERVTYQQRIEGDMLAIDFERPATAASPAAGAEPFAADVAR
jgi:hypothetical protein